MPGTLLTATFVTGGSVTVDDSIAVTAIGTLTTAIGANTAMLEKQFGSTAAVSSVGGLTSIASAQASSLKLILETLQKQNDILRDINLSLGKVAGQSGTGTTGLANIQHTLIEQKTLNAMAFADQQRNNLFQQAATNQALVDAGKPPIVVEPAKITTATKQTLTDVGTINAQIGLTTLIQEYITESITKGLAISQEWIAQTAFAQFILSYYAEAKVKAQLLYADDKTAETLKKQLNDIVQKRNNPTAVS